MPLHPVTTPPARREPLPGLTPPRERIRSVRLLGQVVCDLGFATGEAVDRTVKVARATGVRLGSALVDEGIITPDELARALAERLGIEHIDLDLFAIDLDVAGLIPPETARRVGAVPVHEDTDGTLLVATADPTNVRVLDDLTMLTGRRMRPVVAAEDSLRELVGRLTPMGLAGEAAESVPDQAAREVTRLHRAADDAPVVRLVDSILARAVQRGASDVHFDPADEGMRVRLRVDGELDDPLVVPARLAPGVVARLKIVASLDIAERRAPQDGRASLELHGREVDVRVVTLPVIAGEAAVVRILDPLAVPGSPAKLGMREPELSRLLASLERSHGGVLVTGPTGSGKTTTLYAALAQRNTGRDTIITIEDPVEYRLDGVKQMHVNPRAGVTFASGLRSIVRADPDVIMVGEIRDRETARIAVESALTGHLVLSTLHTRDAPNAVARLLEMDVAPFLLASAIDCVVAQRLVRRLCEDCRVPEVVPAAVLRDHGFDAGGDIDAFAPAGCGRCGQTGYRGRTGVFEVLALDEELRALVLERASVDALATAAVARGMRRMADDGLDKVRDGTTSCAELVRVCGTRA